MTDEQIIREMTEETAFFDDAITFAKYLLLSIKNGSGYSAYEDAIEHMKSNQKTSCIYFEDKTQFQNWVF